MISVPWVTIAFVVLAIALSAFPSQPELLQYDRSAVEGGAYWRLLTAQLVHWTPGMTLTDLLVVFLAGAWVEIESRRIVASTFLAAAFGVGAGVHLLARDVVVYRGSSGIASALFLVACLGIVTASERRSWVRGTALLGLLLFAAKIGWEASAGGAVATGDLPPGVTVSPLAHIVGGCAGALCFATMRFAPRAVAGSRGC